MRQCARACIPQVGVARHIGRALHKQRALRGRLRARRQTGGDRVRKGAARNQLCVCVRQ